MWCSKATTADLIETGSSFFILSMALTPQDGCFFTIFHSSSVNGVDLFSTSGGISVFPISWKSATMPSSRSAFLGSPSFCPRAIDSTLTFTQWWYV